MSARSTDSRPAKAVSHRSEVRGLRHVAPRDGYKGDMKLHVVVPLLLPLAGSRSDLRPVAQDSQELVAVEERGLWVDEKVPAFHLRDQGGKEQTLDSLAGPKGLLLLFVRSADW